MQKNRKIHKKVKRNQQRNFRKQQGSNEDPVLIEENQQVLLKQGLFEGMEDDEQIVEEREEATENKNEDKNGSFETQYKTEAGYFQIIKIDKPYRIFNTSKNIKCMVKCVFGQVNINGKICTNFYVQSESNVAIVGQTHNLDIKTSKQIIKDTKGKSLSKNIKQLLRTIREDSSIKMENNQISPQLVEYFQKFDPQSSCVLYSTHEYSALSMNCNPPWHGIDPNKYIASGQSTMLVGPKNTGKSMFCQYLLNCAIEKHQQLCVLDLDIGRNRLWPGSISLQSISNTGHKNTFSIWIGQFTPVNSIPVYFRAIEELLMMYKSSYYTANLIVNTMGYLTGIGELVLYQIYSIIKPKNVLLLQSSAGQDWSAVNIKNCIESGNYTERLVFNNLASTEDRTRTKVTKYKNQFAMQKSNPKRFQNLICNEPVSSFDTLLSLILSKRLSKLSKNIILYSCSKESELTEIENYQSTTEMRLVILGKINNNLMFVSGIGFGWDGSISYDKNLVKDQDLQVGVISEGVDFEKSFYQTTESRIVEIEQALGRRVPYLLPVFKVLGNKGLRNNPAKRVGATIQ